MHLVITGASSYIGEALTQLLISRASLGGQPITRLTRTDLQLPTLAHKPEWVHDVIGDLCQPDIQKQVLSAPTAYVFHLASVTSRSAEENLNLALNVNLRASVDLLEILRSSGSKPTFVFTSSIGVFGAPLPDQINDQTLIQPTLSYGTHKRMLELLIADYSRLGHIDGRTVRLSGVIARPLQAIGAFSTFSSDLLRHLAAGRPYTCPVSPDSTNWLISLPCCLEQLLHAALTPTDAWPTSRAVTLPTQRVLTGDLVNAMAQLYGDHCLDLITWQPQPHIEAQFGRWPKLETPLADQLGFSHDQTIENLVSRALAPLSA